MRKFTHEKFIEELNSINPTRSYKVIDIYKGLTKFLLLENQYGAMRMISRYLLEGQNPTIQSAINKNEYFTNMAQEIHGESYDYSLVEYKTYHNKVKIICQIHGIFEQTPSNHINGRNGCSKCGFNFNALNRKLTTEQFIEKAKLIHGNKYDYSKVIYEKNQNDKLIIICNIKGHGEFKQRALNHLIGRGCHYCGIINSTKNRITFLSCNEKKFTTGSTLYLIKCWNETEEFYKIGITTKNVNERFIKNKIPYNYEIILEYKELQNSLWSVEQQMHLEYNIYKYYPNKKFSGYTECYNLDLPVKKIIKQLDK